MPSSLHKADLQTTTVRIPRRLYQAARSVVERKTAGARTLNELLVNSLSEKLDQLRRQRIDAEFAKMKDDLRYRLESGTLMDDFAVSDWEAIRTAEKHKR